MRVILGTLLVASVVSVAFPLRAADEDAKAPLFAEPKKDWAWDEDKRFDFLIERLASLEASLDAVNAAIAKATGKKGAKLGEARRAEENNTLMDRKGGGPMKWDEFYGTNAEKFFYHPVDPNTTYRTETFLRQMGKGEDDKYDAAIPSRQSVPVHQRPPQFDYIYKANRDARDRAEGEAAKLAGKVETLMQRRLALEREQADLWCQLAFRAIQRLDIPRKPVLRFQLVSASGDTADVQKTEALAAAARFLATTLLIIDKAEADQATALGNVKDIVTKARNDFDDALLNTDAVAEDVTDAKTTLGKYVALAKLLDDTSSNLSDSYEVAMEGDRADDLARKDRFRGLLQRSLVEYAQIVLALDELAGVMKTDWKVKVDTKSKARLAEVSWGPAKVKVVAASPAAEAKEPPAETPKPKKTPAGKGLAVPNPKDKSWLLVIRDVDSYKEHWKELPGNSYFYDPKTNVISADGAPYGNLGEIHAEEAWQEIYFEMAVQQISFGRCTVTVNGKPFKIGQALDNAKNGVPVRIVYVPDEQSAKVFVGNGVAAETNVFEQDWNRSLKCEIAGGGGGHASVIKIRNFYIRKPAE